MVDINQGWELRTATRMVRVLGEFLLTWIELGRLRPACLGVGPGGRREHGAAGGRREPARRAGIPPDARGFPPRLRAAGLLQVGWCLGHPAGGARRRGHGARLLPALPRGGIGQLTSLHLLAAVRGRGMLEMDANPNPLRTLLIDPVLRVTDGAVPATQGSASSRMSKSSGTMSC